MSDKRNKEKKLTKEQLDAMVEEATVDCYDEYECIAGFFSMIDDNLEFPFEALVIGEVVRVTGTMQKDNTSLLAVCERNNEKYTVNIFALDFDWTKVKGGEWIEAYREWRGHMD